MTLSINKNIVCSNCLKLGHIHHNCKLPITSYGIIVFRKKLINGIYSNQYLMIRRKDSFGYIDFIKGKYSLYNIEQLQNIINEMSNNEKLQIKTENFDKLKNMLWDININTTKLNIINKTEDIISQKKFESLRGGIDIDNKNISLTNMIKNSNTDWKEPEWEFPKGRKNFNENDLECAKREFVEETGYPIHMVEIFNNILPFEEIFIGSNYKSYKHKYFLGYINNDIDILDNYQKSEVSKIEWKTYEECISSIRPINIEKKNIITNIHNILNKYNYCKIN